MLNGNNLHYFEYLYIKSVNVEQTGGLWGDVPPGNFENFRCGMARISAFLSLDNKGVKCKR